MPKGVLIQRDFTAGELSPRLGARVGTDRYNSGAETILNAVVLPSGGVLRRSGFKYIAGTKTNSTASRLVAFEFSTTQAYILEFGNLYIRVYKNGAQVVSAPSTPVEIVTTYTTAQIWDLRFSQSLDTLYITHPAHPPATLTRTSDTIWTLADITFTGGPFRTANTTAVTITPSATTGAGITLTASSSTFVSTHVGALWKLSHPSQVETVGINAVMAAAAQYSTNLASNGLMTLTITGTWTGWIYVQRSYDGGSTWETLATSYTSNTTVTLTEPAVGTLYRVRSNDVGLGTGTAVVRLSQTNAIDFGIARVTGFTSATIVTATVIDDFYSTAATTDWAEGAWSDYRGYPALSCFYENRLMFAANTEKPTTVWGSNTDDYYDFGNTANLADSEAVEYTLLSRQMNAIRWMEPANRLRIGTAGAEWWMSGATDSEPLTPSSVRTRADMNHGSASKPTARISDSLVFVQRLGRRLFDTVFNWQTDSYEATELSTFAEHLFRDGTVVDIAYQQNPHSILWIVRSDGTLLGLTYNRSREIVAWHRHTTTGSFESVAVIPGTDRDEVWCVVNRTVNAGTVRYVEQLAADFDDDVDCEDAFFMDSGAIYNGWNTTVTKYLKVAGLIIGEDFKSGDSVALMASGHTPFTAGSVGAYYRLRSGSDVVDAVVTAYYNTSSVYATLIGDAPSSLQNVYTNDWALMASTLALAHLTAETVKVVADGGVHADCAVSAGAITLDSPAAIIHAGMSYTTDIKTLRPELPTAAGTSQGRKKSVSWLAMRLYQTRGVQVGRDADHLDVVPFDNLSDDYSGIPLPVYSGDYPIDFDGGIDSDAQVLVRQDQPLPLCVLGIMTEIETFER